MSATPLAYVENARRVVGQVEEESDTVKRSILLEVLLEEASGLHVDTHSGEDDGEVVLVTVVNTLCASWTLDEAGLTTDLGGDLRSVSTCHSLSLGLTSL
jgi:hypothetical protein